jgi:hypothetical protein
MLSTQTVTRAAGRRFTFSLLPALLLVFLISATAQAMANGPIKVVVVPSYTELGSDVRDGGNRTVHYRRVMRYINNQLVKHGFEVVNPTAAEYIEEEQNVQMQRSRQDSILSARALCKKYATDVAMVVWLKVKAERADRGLTRVKAILEGEGYDAAGMDLGIGLEKNWTVTANDKDDAIIKAEKDVGYEVGRVLTAWRGKQGRSSRTVVGGGAVGGSTVVTSSSAPAQGGVLQRRAEQSLQYIYVNLDGAVMPETGEVFGKIVNTTTGIVAAKLYGQQITPGNPQASYIKWRVQIEETDPFRVQTNIMKMINDVLDSGGDLTMRGVPYRYTPAEVDMLRGIRTSSTNPKVINFIVDRERMRDADFSERHDPYKAGGFD